VVRDRRKIQNHAFQEEDCDPSWDGTERSQKEQKAEPCKVSLFLLFPLIEIIQPVEKRREKHTFVLQQEAS
jgi:hypothetical protein